MKLAYINEDGKPTMVSGGGKIFNVPVGIKNSLDKNTVLVVRDDSTHTIVVKGKNPPESYLSPSDYNDPDAWWIQDVFAFTDHVNANEETWNKIEEDWENQKNEEAAEEEGKSGMQLRKKK